MDLQSCFAEVGISSGPLEKLPYGYGPYVARNQLIGMVGDTGSPGRRHVQYEIVTDRYVSLYGSGLNTYDCRDNPYLDVCVTDYARPGFFFPINRKKPNEVRGPVYTNPGFVTPPPAPTAPPTPTPGPGISCLNEITANVDNTNLQPWDEDVLNQWLSRFPQTTITGVIHMRDPFSFGQSPEYMLNPCQPSWEVLYQGLPYDTSFQLRVTVYYDENGVPQSESKTFLFDRNSDPYAGKYIKDLEYSFTIPSNSRYEIAMERGQSSMPSSGERDPLVNACLEGYVWGNARNLGGQAQLCGVPISCDLDRTNTSNPYCGPQSDCGGPSGWGGSGKYWAWELGSPTRDLIEWQTCSP
ncbi:hypothetical protein COY32_07015 [candidate division WWE3 bacterium CG_4_10_14_0_2_um_filter_41_14]|uniref:Uncharacterized protein n=1 Tax=candidate division WWE3 bacterium CG_4_10_14_0_2_um_filter_41_14 TaxID=1975072 RepID=A0A2M7TET3_UNCKA|nr:MAG: hypothetical protein COY32_07015 [candidate division WWE3 bacterium CG_4_10_14_0_2_um_filter_41_14]